LVLEPAPAAIGVYVRGEATRKGRRVSRPLPESVERAGEAKTKSGRVIQAFAVQCPVCARWRPIKRKDHALAHAGKPCKKCSTRRAKEIYRGFRMSWFRKYEYHAGMRNKEWGLSVDEAVDVFEQQNGRCALTGLPLTTNGPFNDITASLDRIDNSKGYTPDNVHWVHKAVNFMRGDMPLAAFVESCRAVAQHTCNWSW
jgi:hypothetical protein